MNKRLNISKPETIPCKICGVATEMMGTKLCDNCWEVLHRIREMPVEWVVRLLTEAGYASILIKP
jgi:hypothetical protein